MPKRRRDEAAPRQPDRARSPATRPARLALEVPHRLHDRPLVRTDDPPCDLGLGDAEQDAHALRRTKRQIEPRDRTRRPHRPQQQTRTRVTALEQPPQPVLADLARQPEPCRACPHPHARRFAFARVVVLATLRDLIDVIPLGSRATGELADRHHPVPQAAETAVRAIGSRRMLEFLPQRQTGPAESEQCLGSGHPVPQGCFVVARYERRRRCNDGVGVSFLVLRARSVAQSRPTLQPAEPYSRGTGRRPAFRQSSAPGRSAWPSRGGGRSESSAPAANSNQTWVVPSWMPQRLVRAATMNSPRPLTSPVARARILCSNPPPWSITSPYTVPSSSRRRKTIWPRPCSMALLTSSETTTVRSPSRRGLTLPAS